MSREITIFVKLPSIPALVVMTVIGSAHQICEALTNTGHDVRRVGSDTVIIEEKR